ncbi:MAG TPA: deoxyribodipyrimidine photolyase, partial [Kofleriaceae bacterium]
MDSRVTDVNDRAMCTTGDYVLYWMIAARRTTYNFALDRARQLAAELGKPLAVLEPLRAGYKWASDRHHAFVIEGMRDNAAAFERANIAYVPYVEPSPGAGKGLLAALAKHACVVVTDEQPGFFLPRMVAAAGEHLDVKLEQVDGNGLMPLRGVDRWFSTAASFRRELQKQLAPHLIRFPAAKLPHAKLPRAKLPSLARWRSAAIDPSVLAKLPIDHAVAPVGYRGGSAAANKLVHDFIAHKLSRYAEDHNDPDRDGASGLSPYLHFGHVSAHEVVARVWADADWDPSRLAGAKVTGSREGWWGLPASSEAFLDELVTWRELGYVFCHHRADWGTYDSLPAWARATLDKHAKDPRSERYTRAELEHAETADPIWNAAQRQLVGDGRIHNYLRMLWGKKILEWSASPRAAFEMLVELNNKYSVDGRDPSSNSGICWTLGLFDRAWGPERPIFG